MAMQIVRHQSVADMAGDSWRFWTAEQLADIGAVYDPATDHYRMPEPPGDWWDLVEQELISMGGVALPDWTQPEWIGVPRCIPRQLLYRRGWEFGPGGLAKRAWYELGRYAAHKGWPAAYMQPQYRDEAVDRAARRERDSGGCRNDGADPAVVAQPLAAAAPAPPDDPNQLRMYLG